MGLEGEVAVRSNVTFYSEKVRLFFKFPANPTVGIRRDKKQSRSTHRDLLVGTGFVSFQQTP